MIDLVDDFVCANTALITRAGIEKPHLFWETGTKRQSISISLDTGVGMGYVARIWDEKPSKLIFGFDRYLSENKGTKFKDALSVSYWNGKKWMFGIMEYQFIPKTVLGVNWKNKFWGEVFREEAETVGILSGGGHCRFTEDGVHLWHQGDNSQEFCSKCFKLRPGT